MFTRAAPERWGQSRMSATPEAELYTVELA
jgi:hypothetical protein